MKEWKNKQEKSNKPRDHKQPENEWHLYQPLFTSYTSVPSVFPSFFYAYTSNFNIWICFFSVNSHYLLDYMQCYYTRDLVTIEFIDSWYFDKVEYMRYNSTTDRYTGYTVYGARLAEVLNLNPQSSLKYLVDSFCKDSSDRYASNVLKKGVNIF